MNFVYPGMDSILNGEATPRRERVGRQGCYHQTVFIIISVFIFPTSITFICRQRLKRESVASSNSFVLKFACLKFRWLYVCVFFFTISNHEWIVVNSLELETIHNPTLDVCNANVITITPTHLILVRYFRWPAEWCADEQRWNSQIANCFVCSHS